MKNYVYIHWLQPFKVIARTLLSVTINLETMAAKYMLNIRTENEE